jgi:outer membrane protein assembly factor BamB
MRFAIDLFAIVPIFTGAGVALLPTIVAAVASVAAVAMKPREMFRLCRRRPATVAVAVVCCLLAVVSCQWLIAGSQRAKTDNRQITDNRQLPTDNRQLTTASRCDWAKVAEDLIAREHAGKAPTVLAGVSRSDAPLVLGHDFSRCSYDGGPSPVRLNPLWSFRPEETMFLSSPVVAGNRVFAAGCQNDLGGYTGLLACIDADSGKPLWQVTQAGDEPLRPFFSSPALSCDGKYLVIGQGLHTDRDCSLLCLDAATGRLRWAVKTTLHIESSPAIFRDMVVVGAGAIEGPDGKPVGDPGFVLAVRLEDGKEFWRQPVNDPESAPAVDESGTVYIGSGFNGNAVVAIRGDSEEQLRAKKLDRIAWRTPIELPATCPITLAEDLVIAGAGNSDVVHSNRNARGLVVAMDRKTGAIRWQVSFADAVLGAIACRDGIVICPSRTGEVTALAVRDGSVLWRTRVSGSAPVLAGCALTGRRVYAVASDGYLAVLDPKSGSVLEKQYLNDQAKPGTGLTLSGPRIVRGRVFVGSETGGLCCLVGSESAE